jgi:ribosomal protein S3
MGQKTHPRGLRVGIIEGWDSKWYAPRSNYTTLLHEDLKLRDFIKKRLYHAGISRIEIERMANKAKVNIHTARPGIVIGKKGAEIDRLKNDVQKLMKGREAFINIHEVRRPDLDPQLVAENIALQLERRVRWYARCGWGRRGCVCRSRDVSAGRKSRAANGIAKGACRSRPCAPTSPTVSPKPAPLTA